MKKHAVMALSLFLALNSSQASTSSIEKVLVSQQHSGLKIQTRTKSALVRAVPRAQRRLLVSNNLSDGDEGPPGTNELDLHRSYRRPELVIDHDQYISDHAKTRLLIARVRALQKYRETWG